MYLDFALLYLLKICYSKLDFASQHPSKLRFDNTKNEKKRSSELGVFFLILVFIRDLDWIQTSNLLSRNQVRYSVAPRGL